MTPSGSGVWISVSVFGRPGWEVQQRPAGDGRWEVLVRGHGVLSGAGGFPGQLADRELVLVVIGVAAVAEQFLRSLHPTQLAALQAAYRKELDAEDKVVPFPLRRTPEGA